MVHRYPNSRAEIKAQTFCLQLLRLGDQQLLNVVANWLFTDEKWWDIVGPSMARYVKAGSKKEAKMQNQVFFFLVFFGKKNYH